MIFNNMARRRALLAGLLLLCLALSLQLTGVQWTGSAAAVEQKTPKPEEVVERAVYVYGTRLALYNVQRNGIIRAQIKFISPEGTREGRSTSKFIRKPKLNEDLLMLELDLPGTKYTIGFDGQQTWTINNGVIEEPATETVAAFRSAHLHSYEALLRYKENDGKIEYLGSKQFGPNNELDLIELTLPDGTKTQYEISRRSARVIYLNYEEKGATPDAPPVKYRLYFKDFRYIQNALIPYEVQVFRDGTLIEERKVVEVAYSVQMEESAFKAENANKPAEAAVKP